MIEFRVLGAFEALEDQRPVAVGGPKQRALLAVLVLRRGEVVSSDRLIDAVWGERAPASAVKIVQGYVSQLRRALGEGVLVTRGHGYLLATESCAVDVDRFEGLVGEGRRLLRSGDARGGRELLREGLALWRGPPLADFAYEPFAQGEIARLEEARLAALEDRIDSSRGDRAPHHERGARSSMNAIIASSVSPRPPARGPSPKQSPARRAGRGQLRSSPVALSALTGTRALAAGTSAIGARRRPLSLPAHLRS